MKSDEITGNPHVSRSVDWRKKRWNRNRGTTVHEFLLDRTATLSSNLLAIGGLEDDTSLFCVVAFLSVSKN